MSLTWEGGAAAFRSRASQGRGLHSPALPRRGTHIANGLRLVGRMWAHKQLGHDRDQAVPLLVAEDVQVGEKVVQGCGGVHGGSTSCLALRAASATTPATELCDYSRCATAWGCRNTRRERSGVGGRGTATTKGVDGAQRLGHARGARRPKYCAGLHTLKSSRPLRAAGAARLFQGRAVT